MWLLKVSTERDRLELHHFNSTDEVEARGGYAILSHVWTRDPTDGKPDEQSFQEVRRLQAEDVSYRDWRTSRKVRNCIRVAKEYGFGWVWLDTCCIDKTSSAELEEAINSMYRWYAEARICFAYLSDVIDPKEPLDGEKSAFRNSAWFKRCWTLQELIAPHNLIFLSSEWQYLGTKSGLASLLQTITGIDMDVLTFYRPLEQVSVGRRMSWAARRHATRVEDEAYSLLGLFGVSLPTIYGEGRRAFQRLQEEIMRRSPDPTLFAWGRMMLPQDIPRCHIAKAPFAHSDSSSFFAPNPSAFKQSGRFRRAPTSKIRDAVRKWCAVTDADTASRSLLGVEQHVAHTVFAARSP
ncbi:HET-domain-containing protein [Pilatotrama ljubarskyi]|nr:HET-domain-containing protein [Pilatotrama ljubarskyi]